MYKFIIDGREHITTKYWYDKNKQYSEFNIKNSTKEFFVLHRAGKRILFVHFFK